MDAPPASRTVLQGTVERVVFHAPDTRWLVLRVAPERGFGDPEAPLSLLPQRVTAVGRAPAPGEGLRVRMAGRWGEHPTHGRQFAFDAIQLLPPLDADGLVRYLGSKAFEGIGEVLARRIVETLGTTALRIIREEPERLAEVRGLRPAVRDRLVARVREEVGAQELHAFLLGAGLNAWQAEAASAELGVGAEGEVRADPYVLARRVPGVGFRTADAVADRLGLARGAPERRRAALLHALERAAAEGHTMLPAAELLPAAAELLEEPDPETLAGELEAAAARRDLVLDDERRAYLPWLFAAESGLARALDALLGAPPPRPLADADALAAAERGSSLELHPLQREAVLGLLRHPVALLTGGPGVGKTTIVRLVVELAERAHAKVALASPTGRAAKRLGEATGREARTLHRLLGFEPHTGRFRHGRDEPLAADLVVVDEVSMLDVSLARRLVEAVRPPTRLVLVGDPDQLPSVAAGNVLDDLIASGRVPCFRLTRIFRQEEGGLIVENAHRVLEGSDLALPSGSDRASDFYVFPVDDPEAAAERVVEVVTERIPRTFGLDWTDDVQVLAPMYRGACGVDALNARLRAALGSGGEEVTWRGRTWRVGDRVIHTRNDYEKEVFNGDLGRVVRVAADGSGITVRYPERHVGYTARDQGDLQPAFAITVHRAQGGEFPAVVVPLVLAHWTMLQRNLLYTAITRGRKLVVLVGSLRAIRRAIDNAEVGRRRSALAERLRAAAPAP